MLKILLQVDAPSGSAQAIKETLAMYCERYGDTKVLSIKEELPLQMKMDSAYPGTNNNYRGGR